MGINHIFAIMADQIEISKGPCGKFRFTEYPDVRVGLIHLDRKRPWPSCVNPETGNQWADDVKEKMVEILNKSGRKVFRSDEEVKVDDDPSLRQALALCNKNGVDVLVAIQPTISDGRLAPVLAQQWGKGLVFWASPEEQPGMMISGNSLVGSHLMTATLRQLGRPCEFVYSNLDWPTAAIRLGEAVNLGFAGRQVQNTKIALIGNQAPGFVDFHPNPFLLSKTFGSILQHVGLTEYTTTAIEVVSDNFDALAIRCWPELPGPQGLSQWAYMALARLATEGFPIACEGDVDGAFSCMVGKMLVCGAVYLSDWLEHDKNTLTLWHGGMAPFQLSEAVGTPLGPCISRHFNNKVPGCLDATIKIGLDVTVFRLWVMNNQYHLLVLEGRTIKPKRHILGNNGLVEFSPPVDLVSGFDRWLEKGFPHHVCVVQGKQKTLLAKFARDHGVLVLE